MMYEKPRKKKTKKSVLCLSRVQSPTLHFTFDLAFAFLLPFTLFTFFELETFDALYAEIGFYFGDVEIAWLGLSHGMRVTEG